MAGPEKLKIADIILKKWDQLNVKEDLLKTFWSVNANSHIKQKNMIDWITENYGKRQGKEGIGIYQNGSAGYLLQGFKFIEKEVSVFTV